MHFLPSEGRHNTSESGFMMQFITYTFFGYEPTVGQFNTFFNVIGTNYDVRNKFYDVLYDVHLFLELNHLWVF